MVLKSNKKIYIFVFLTLLTVIAFINRYQNFLKPNVRSVDEMIYLNLGRQLSSNPGEYNIVDYVNKYCINQYDGTLPAYMSKPLFKHPPMFASLIALSFRLFGDSPGYAVGVSILMAVLMIPVVYLLGTLLFNRFVGVLSAVFMAIDPVSIMTSQKIWLDTTVSFFMFLNVYLFAYAVKKNRNSFFVFSGIAGGCALLTKYTGVLVILGGLLYAFIYEKDLFKNKYFVSYLYIPFLMLIPWFYWNYIVYGFDFILNIFSLHGFRLSRIMSKGSLLFVLFGIILMVYYKVYNRISLNKDYRLQLFLKIALGVLVFSFVSESVLLSLNFSYVPETRWAASFRTANGNMFFYFDRLVEYSLIYLFAFAAFFISDKNKDSLVDFVKIAVLLILLFFTVWRNYQCRYILSCIPLLIVLGVSVIQKIFLFSFTKKNICFKSGSCIFFIILLLFMFCRTMNINLVLSFTNDMGYF